MKKNHTMKKIIAGFVLSLFLANVGYSASEILLKSGSDVKYQNLIKCVKYNNNDISYCIEEFTSYLQAEKKLLNAAVNKEKYQGRLVKMINYLKKSTDMFIEKAEKSNVPKDWNKAAKCGTLLSRLSSKYASYKDISNRYETARKASSTSKALAALLDEIKSVQSPDMSYVSKFKKYTNHVSRSYDKFSLSFQKNSTRYAQLKINQYVEKISKQSENYVEEQNVSFEDAFPWHSTYYIAINMPGVDPKTEEEKKARTSICNKIPDYVKLKNKADKIIDSGLELYVKNKTNKLGSILSDGKAVLDTAEMGLVGASYLKNICPSVPVDFSSQLNQLRDSYAFLKEVYSGYQFAEKNDMKSLEVSLYKAIQIDSVDNIALNLAKKTHKETLNKLLIKTKDNVIRAMKNKEPFVQILTQLDSEIVNHRGAPEYPNQLIEIQKNVVDEWGTAVRKGKKKVTSIQDVIVAYKPSTSLQTLFNPPLEGPENNSEFYAWQCKLDRKSNIGYVCWDTKWILEGGELEGFIFDDVKANFTELRFKTTVLVIGRYVKNVDVTMILGNMRPLPYLKDSYVFPLNYTGYSWKKLEKLF